MASFTPICCIGARPARYDELVNMALIAVSGHPGCRFEEVARFSAQHLGFELLTQSRLRALTSEAQRRAEPQPEPEVDYEE